MSDTRATVYIVDDDASVRKSLTRLVSTEGHDVVTFASPDEFLALDGPQHPACLVLDIRMPNLSGLDLQERLAERTEAVPIIFLTGHGDVPSSVRAFKGGATDFLQKPVDADQLLSAIRDAIAKDAEAEEQHAAAAEAQALADTLTPRELEVFRHVITGKLNKQIAADLAISEKTVKVHRGRVTEKLGVASVAELVRLAERAGISPAEGDDSQA